MVRSLVQLSTGILTILAASAVLLLADLDGRKQSRADAADGDSRPRLALVQHATIDPLDEGVRGVLWALKDRGFIDGETVTIDFFNAQGDVATSNTIAKEVTGKGYDVIVTSSTISLQTVANANRFRDPPRRHVFGLTSNPFEAGVGIGREDPFAHPPYMAGLGSLPPVHELFELLKEVHPTIARVGLVWNPAEANSEAATRLARAAAEEFELQLVEGNADSSTAAGEVAASVLARGVDALWISTDITVSTASDVMIEAARRAGVPVVTSLPGTAKRGALIDLGSSFFDIGAVQGQLVADVLEGRELASVPILNWTPNTLHVNLDALEGLRETWRIPASVLAQASVVIDAGRLEKREVPRPAPPASLAWTRTEKAGGSR
jgi:ABC-type uncharacterized transport system substrate-binding protein